MPRSMKKKISHDRPHPETIKTHPMLGINLKQYQAITCRGKTRQRARRKFSTYTLIFSCIYYITLTTMILIIVLNLTRANAKDLINASNRNLQSDSSHNKSIKSPMNLETTIINQQVLKTNSSSEQPRIITQTNQEQYDKCRSRRSCRATSRSRMLDVDAKKQSCMCDQACHQYDDCCADSKFASAIQERKNEHDLRATRSQWYCHRTGLFGDVYIKASCSSDWIKENIVNRDQSVGYSRKSDYTNQAEVIKRNCEYITSSGIVNSYNHDQSSIDDPDSSQQQTPSVPQLDDPLGMMMHITDLISGITYANSYCLQCNAIDLAKSKLIYWSPIIDCNYDSAKDDRNNLLDLIHSGRGDVLKYSKLLQRWIMDVPDNHTQTNNERKKSIFDNYQKQNHKEGNYVSENATVLNLVADRATDAPTKVTADYRTCTIEPIVPNSVEHIIRFCRANVIDRCLTYHTIANSLQNITISSSAMAHNSTNKTLVDECHLGHQSLVYSQTTDLAYRNLACAHCNNEFNVHCEPKMRKILPDANQGRRLSPDAPIGADAPVNGPTVFSVLLDIYSSSQDDQQVGVVRKCPGENQVFDTIFNKCRDIVCGMNQVYENGKCISTNATTQLNDTNKSKTNGQKKNIGVRDTSRGSKPTDQVIVNSLNSSLINISSEHEPLLPTLSPERDARAHSHQSKISPSSNNSDSSALASNTDELFNNHQQPPHRSDRNSNYVQDSHFAGDKITESNGRSSGRNLGSIDEPNENETNVARYISQTDSQTTSKIHYNDTAPQFDLSSLASAHETDRLANDYANNDAYIVAPLATMAEPDAATRQRFMECGKIVVPKTHFRLLNNTSPNNKTSLIAHVRAYNLTLNSAQFTLDQNRENLLICAPFKSDYKPKFKPIMGIITAIGLIISITSLTLFLLLYILSTCVACATRSRNGSMSGNIKGGPSSLSSRGVVCLSTSLLLAYVLFLGSQQSNAINQNPEICEYVAVGTYFCFLMSFNWMFLLSYDVWRTLRLATCHLRGPVIHAQSKRFLIYMIYSLTVSICIVSMAVYIEMQPRSLYSNYHHHPQQQYNQSNNNGSNTNNDSNSISTNNSRIGINASEFSKPEQLYRMVMHTIINDYKPRFGQRQGSCWFTNRRGLALFFGLPVTVIMIFNSLFFIHSSIMVIVTSTRSSRKAPPQVGVASVYRQERRPSNDEYKELKKKFSSRTISSASLASSGTTATTFECMNPDKSVYPMSVSRSGSYEVPDIIPGNTDIDEIAANENQSIIGKIRRFFGFYQKVPCPSLESLNSTPSCNECDNGNYHAGEKMDIFDNNLTIQSTIDDGISKHIGDHIKEEQNCLDSQKIQAKSPIAEAQNKRLGSNNKKRVSIVDSSGEQPSVKDKPDETAPNKWRSSSSVSRQQQLQQNFSIVLAAVSKDYRLYWRLSTIMGLTWLTGVIASFSDSDILWYMFVILNTLQGLFIFIAFGCKKSKLTHLEPLLRKFNLCKKKGLNNGNNGSPKARMMNVDKGINAPPISNSAHISITSNRDINRSSVNP